MSLNVDTKGRHIGPFYGLNGKGKLQNGFPISVIAALNKDDVEKSAEEASAAYEDYVAAREARMEAEKAYADFQKEQGNTQSYKQKCEGRNLAYAVENAKDLEYTTDCAHDRFALKVLDAYCGNPFGNS